MLWEQEVKTCSWTFINIVKLADIYHFQRAWQMIVKTRANILILDKIEQHSYLRDTENVTVGM